MMHLLLWRCLRLMWLGVWDHLWSGAGMDHRSSMRKMLSHCATRRVLNASICRSLYACNSLPTLSCILNRSHATLLESVANWLRIQAHVIRLPILALCYHLTLIVAHHVNLLVYWVQGLVLSRMIAVEDVILLSRLLIKWFLMFVHFPLFLLLWMVHLERHVLMIAIILCLMPISLLLDVCLRFASFVCWRVLKITIHIMTSSLFTSMLLNYNWELSLRVLHYVQSRGVRAWCHIVCHQISRLLLMILMRIHLKRLESVIMNVKSLQASCWLGEALHLRSWRLQECARLLKILTSPALV